MPRQPAKEPRHLRRACKAPVIAVLLVVVPIAQAAKIEKGDPRKPAWKWTVEERLAARFDQDAMAAREAARQTEMEALRDRYPDRLPRAEEPVQTPEPPATETIDGSRNPELFLPGELFDMLLNHVFHAEKGRAEHQAIRSFYEEQAAALGMGRDLWDRLEEAAAPYLGLRYAEDQPLRAAGANVYKEEEDRIRICRARAQALAAAETAFGGEAFLRLLYEVVAPHTRKASLLSPDYQRYAERLRYQEGGCR